MDQDPNEIEVVLRGASDGLLLAIREVGARERMKRGVNPADPAFPKLAREVRIAADTVLALARQEELAAEKAATAPPSAAMSSIERTAPAEDLAAILADWRAVERRLDAAEVGSSEAQALMTQFEQLRDEYAEALKAHQRKS